MGHSRASPERVLSARLGSGAAGVVERGTQRGQPRALGVTDDDNDDQARSVSNLWEEERVTGPTTPITYILPDEGWAPLLEIIVRECPAASVIEVNMAGM